MKTAPSLQQLGDRMSRMIVKDPAAAAAAHIYVQGSLKRFWATLRHLSAVIPPPEASCHLLDLGAYPGYLTLAIQERFGHRITGVTALTTPAFEHQMAQAGIRVLVHDIERAPLPFAEESFDLVLALDLIEHLTFNVPFVLSQAFRVLRQHGALVLTTPNLASVWNRWALLRGRAIGKPLSDGEHPFYGHPPDGDGGPLPEWLAMRHVREFTKAELAWLLQHSGFPRPAIEFMRFPMNYSGAGLSPTGYVSALGFQGLARLVPSLRAYLTATAVKP